MNVIVNQHTHVPQLLLVLTLMVAMSATMTIVGPDGERTVPAGDFFLGVYLTAAGPGELLTRITIPPLDDGADGFAAVTIGAEGTCITNAAASVRDGNARVAIGCVDAVPILVTASADGDAVAGAVGEAALTPPSDVHASADYRRHLAAVLARRAVMQARQGG